jgi:hypothetical protein
MDASRLGARTASAECELSEARIAIGVRRAAGIAAIAGGALGVLLAPVMVAVKYMTGWAVIPEPSWIAVFRTALGKLLTFTTPVGLWVIYGRLYTAALLLMFAGIVAFAVQTRESSGRVRPRGLWVLMIGFCLVILGDAVHTATWHQNGLTVPTPGTNPLANTGYAVHMMGMNLVLVGSVMTGIAGLRRRILPRWLAWLFVLVAPAAVGLSLTVLPTSPSGGLSMFHVTMIAVGWLLLRSGRIASLSAAPAS